MKKIWKQNLKNYSFVTQVLNNLSLEKMKIST
jgi:hypothetical protein